jgi:hypothetical protein
MPDPPPTRSGCSFRFPQVVRLRPSPAVHYERSIELLAVHGALTNRPAARIMAPDRAWCWHIRQWSRLSIRRIVPSKVKSKIGSRPEFVERPDAPRPVFSRPCDHESANSQAL